MVDAHCAGGFRRFLVGAVAAGRTTFALQSRELKQRLEGDVQARAEGLARTAPEGDWQDLIEQVHFQSRTWQDGATLVAFIDYRTGETIGNLKVAEPFEGLQVLRSGTGILGDTDGPSDKPDAYYAYGIRTNMGWVLAARDESWVVDSGEILLQSSFWGLVAALLLAVGLAAPIARSNDRRIFRMEQVLAEVQAGSLQTRINESAQDAIGRVAGQIDTTLDRLEAGVEAIRHVSTDVAHDLRAPLSRLRMRLESRALDPELPIGTSNQIGDALSDIDGITQTFDAILRLAWIQSGSVGRNEETVDLCALSLELEDLVQASAEDAGHEFLLKLPKQAVVVKGDRELLTQALVNLIDNSMRHCPAPAWSFFGVAWRLCEKGFPEDEGCSSFSVVTVRLYPNAGR